MGLRSHGNNDRLLGGDDLMLSGFGPSLVLHLRPLGLRLACVLSLSVYIELSVHQHWRGAGGLGSQDLQRTIHTLEGGGGSEKDIHVKGQVMISWLFILLQIKFIFKCSNSKAGLQKQREEGGSCIT